MIGPPRLHHVAIGARDVNRVASFYRDGLGLPEVRRHYTESGELRSVWLDLGGAWLMVERTQANGVHVEGVGAGPFLIAVRVSQAERGAWERHLSDYGASIEARTDYTSYARDPEGNRIAISHYDE